MLHQNNTCPIMAGGCHVVMTENVVIKGDDIKRQCWTTSLFLGATCTIISAHFPRLCPPFPADLTVSRRRCQRGPRTHETGRWPRKTTRSRDFRGNSRVARERRKLAAISRGWVAGTRTHGCQNSMKTPPFVLGCGCKRLPSSVPVPPGD